jgi:dTDP-4-amino-4,6-dideoxygalactose transaminase
MTIRVPHFDHAANYERDRAAIERAIQRVLAAGEPIMGPDVSAFESEFAALCGARFAMAVMSGTAALLLALRALELQPGDEVVTAANSDIPTSHAVTHAGATVVWADIDPATFNLDPEAVRRAIGPRTRAILPVHLYGVPADMEPIRTIAEEHGLAVVEDAALATGATYRGAPVGSLGDVAAFSTAPGKVLGGICSGGVVTTSSEVLAERVESLRHYGRSTPADPRHRSSGDVPWPPDTVRLGYNERMNAVDAAVLRIRLSRLSGDIAVRRSHAERYRSRLRDTGVRWQQVPDGAEPVWRTFTVRVPDRDGIYAALRREGYEVTLPYLPPNHLDVCYREGGYEVGSLPETERFADELLALPCHPFLDDAQVDELSDRLAALLARG